MTAKSKYGNMPEPPKFTAKVKGDAGVFKVWAIDWYSHRVLIDRAGMEWISIAKVAFEPLPAEEESEGQS